jgi:hypothetical protein
MRAARCLFLPDFTEGSSWHFPQLGVVEIEQRRIRWDELWKQHPMITRECVDTQLF